VAFRDIREFLKSLEERGWLQRISVEVDPELEITEITDRISKRNGPALLFEKVKGSAMPLLINAFGSKERMMLALGGQDFDVLAADIESILQPDLPNTVWDKLRLVPRLVELSSYFPKIVKNGPCQEMVINSPSLNQLPILKCWPGDGGRFITLPLVVTKDPENGRRNLGMYRMQVYDDRTTGMHWHLHHDGAENYRKHQKLGKPMEVAVVLGGDPATIYSATAPLPKDIDEMLFAGFLRKEPVEMVRCKTVDLEVPAHAEIILEGYVDLQETRLEGPFGDHTGYYSLADHYPVFHLQCMTTRKNPLYPTTIVGKPPMEDCYMAKATERIFLPLLRLQMPEVVDMNMPLEGVFHNCVILSIRKKYPGQAKKVMAAVWGLGQMMFTKFIIVVDEAVNVQNMSEVLWKVFNNVDPKRDIMIVDGPLDALDHSSPWPHFGAKAGIDATKKWPAEGHQREWPEDILMDSAIQQLVDRRWNEYGLSGFDFGFGK